MHPENFQGAGGGRSAPGPGEDDLHPPRRAGGGRGLHEPPAGRRQFAQCAGTDRFGGRRMAGLVGGREPRSGIDARRLPGI